MNLALRIGAAVTIAVGALLVLASLALAAVAGTDPDPPPPSGKTMVGVYVDNRDGMTESTIDCHKDGYHETVNGDATLFMPNLAPHTVVCVITIKDMST